MNHLKRVAPAIQEGPWGHLSALLSERRGIHKKIVLGMFILLAALMPVDTWASITVSPTLFELQIPRGQSYTGAIQVINVGKAGLTIKVYPSDFDFQAAGNIFFPDAGTGKYSLASYMRVNPTSIDLEPGEEKFMRFTVALPQDAAGEYNCILFFQTLPRGIKSPVKGKQVMVSARIGAGIYAAAKNTVTPSSEISALFFKPAPGNSSFHYALVYHNNGNIHLRPTGKVKILDAAGKELVSSPVNEKNSSVLRGSVRIFDGEFKNIPTFPDGSYKIAAEIDYGKEILEAEKSIYLSNTAGIESFEAKPTGKENDTAGIVFSARARGIGPGKENESRQIVFRIKSTAGEVLATIPGKTSRGKIPQNADYTEYTAEWSGPLKPGTYFAEFLVSLRENETLTSFCLVDNTGPR